MTLKLKNEKVLKELAYFSTIIFIIIQGYWILTDTAWTKYDLNIIDWFYTSKIENGKGPKENEHVIYLNISDSTYAYIENNALKRDFLSEVNNALSELGAEAVAYDIIFARPTIESDDELFKESIIDAEMIYLPIGFNLKEEETPFQWNNSDSHEQLKNTYLFKLNELNSGTPLSANRALTQYDKFTVETELSGHISAFSDPDGVFRHFLMLIKVDSLYMPTLTLSMFMHHIDANWSDLSVEWGNHIKIAATDENDLDKDFFIPIDNHGATFIPYPGKWGDLKNAMDAHVLLEHMKNPNLAGNLEEFFGAGFVFIGDVSVGISDLGQTPLEDDVPLVMIHGSLMNSFLNNYFYTEKSKLHYQFVAIILMILLVISSLFKDVKIFYFSSIVVFVIQSIFFWYMFESRILYPTLSIFLSTFIFFLSISFLIQYLDSKDQKFIRDAFSKYLPQSVINEIVEKPDMLALGGRTDTLSVLFSDIAGFTTISENLSPEELVKLLNQYLTAMTNIIMENKGIIDKYEGDAIMAEFGAPIKTGNHAEQAVEAAIEMQRKLSKLSKKWMEKGFPEITCRIGINTGNMVIGNMGSDQVFDYTVMGDSVNLASRLEGANKVYGSLIMISEATFNELDPRKYIYRKLDSIRVKGKKEPVVVYEIIDHADRENDRRDLANYYNQAVELFLSRKFDAAAKKLDEIKSFYPDDKSIDQLYKRIHSHKNDTSGDSDLTQSLTEK